MCTILIAHQVSKEKPLLVLANRDEFYSRPTAAMHEWKELPGLIAGRDMVAGGTWFGARNQRWALITNVRQGFKDEALVNPGSRGWLTLDYLQSDLHPEKYLNQVRESDNQFAGYNLLLGDGLSLWYVSNRAHQPLHLKPGIYGLSNGQLDTPWPKVVRGKDALKQRIIRTDLSDEELFSLLTDTSVADDKDLPDTGVPYRWEKLLSATFIMSKDYGTRCSTLLCMSKERTYRMVERRYRGRPGEWDQSEFSWAGGPTHLTDSIS